MALCHSFLIRGRQRDRVRRRGAVGPGRAKVSTLNPELDSPRSPSSLRIGPEKASEPAKTAVSPAFSFHRLPTASLCLTRPPWLNNMVKYRSLF